MNYFEIVLVLVILGLGVWMLYLLKDRWSGLGEYNKKMQEKKEAAKEKIMELFESKEKINHSDVVKALAVSKNSAVRYLDELEAESRVRQVGKTGKAVFYTKT